MVHRKKGLKFKKDYYINSKIDILDDDELINSNIFLHRAKWIDENIKKGSILDLGCNNGIISLYHAYNGKRVVGVDLNKNAIEFCNNFLKRYYIINSKYIQSSIESFNINEKFDNILICEVLEHVSNPNKILNIAEKYLLKNGLIFITTPEYYEVFGVNNKDDILEHLWIYKAKDLKKIIEKRGKIIDFCSRQLIYCIYTLK